MNKSQTRRRRLRREREQLERKRCTLAEYVDFDRVASFDALYDSSYVSQKGVIWKGTVQRLVVVLAKTLLL